MDDLPTDPHGDALCDPFAPRSDEPWDVPARFIPGPHRERRATGDRTATRLGADARASRTGG